MIHNTLIANKDEYKPTFVWSPVSTLPLSLLGLFAFGFSGVDGIISFLAFTTTLITFLDEAPSLSVTDVV